MVRSLVSLYVVLDTRVLGVVDSFAEILDKDMTTAGSARVL